MEIWVVWLARLMFVGIFAMGIGMLFRAWKIGVRHDFRFVADWRGRQIPGGQRWAYPVMGINAMGGVALWVLGSLVLVIGLPFTTWTGVTGLLLWSYYFALQIVMHRAKIAHGAG